MARESTSQPVLAADLLSDPQWYETELPGTWQLFPSATVGEVWFTPEICEQQLTKRNLSNRPILPSNLQVMEVGFRNGWIFTGETIIYSWLAELINGQHRMRTCVKTKIPFRSLVAVGVDPKSFKVIDQHAKRRNAVLFAMGGEKNSNLLVSSLNLLQSFLTTGIMTNTSISRTVAENEKYLELHPQIRSSVSRIGTLTDAGMITHSRAINAALHYVFTFVDDELADDLFFGIHRMKFPDEPRWEGANRLLIQLSKIRRGSRPAPAYISSLIIKVWNSLINGKPLRNLSHRESDSYPRVAGLTYNNAGLPVLETLADVPRGA